MVTRNSQTKTSSDRDLVITRVFDAPRETVFKAWSDPERMMSWWGPKSFTTPVCRIDFRVGGKWINCMRAPDGKDYWSTGVYREIVAPERIVTTDNFADAEGNVVPPSYYDMSGDWSGEMLITVTFEDVGRKTKLTLRHEGLPAGEHQSGANEGWSQSFDKLAEYVKKA
jgi:uncharacterized protein YndB with AHSA1/START domain